GETYIPNAPAAQVIDIAKALIGKRDIDIKITGIRPCEKMSEVLVSEEEIHHCFKRGNYYVISPMLPELVDKKDKQPNFFKKEYSSADNVLSCQETLALLKKHKLMVEDGEYYEEELLR
ncbi:MAG: polysaccharide biosynthesis protein, partial [bacterium]|nr:polysaccharide biosynthesis protein [bacterium]